MKQRAFFVIFEALSLKQIKKIFFGRRESDFNRLVPKDFFSVLACFVSLK